MAATNPDFYGVGEVVIPKDFANQMGGWGPDGASVRDSRDYEQKAFAALEEDMPLVMRAQAPQAIPEDRLALWDAFQVSKGRQAGDNDLSLLDEYVHGSPLVWRPQIIGSCVWSNTFRAYVLRMMYEIALLGEPEEYLGRNEYGSKNYAPYGPWSYGMARRRANMRRGDGLYCEPMAESLIKDGVLPCTTPALLQLLASKGLDRDKDFPEPQNSSFYRAMGNWQYLDDLKPYAAYPVKECPMVRSADELWDRLGEGKPAFVCSGEAIHKVGQHRDGFPIHARNPRDSWAHNMAFHGRFTASDGERFVRQSNESWGAQHIYNRRLEEVGNSFRQNRLTVAAIGNITGPQSAPPLAA